jgi:hypothetical protein
MQVQYRLKMGQDEFLLNFDVKNQKDFFNQVSFYSSLPKTAPGGSTDLKIVVRETKKGTYYSLVSESEKLEFQLGQHKEGDTLYAKDWVPLFQGEASEGQQTSAAPVQVATKAFVAPIQAPVQQAVAAPAFVAPMPIPQTIQAPIQQAAPAPIAAPVQAATPVQVTAPAPAANPQVAQVANNVLARFGINKQ